MWPARLLRASLTCRSARRARTWRRAPRPGPRPSNGGRPRPGITQISCCLTPPMSGQRSPTGSKPTRHFGRWSLAGRSKSARFNRRHSTRTRAWKSVSSPRRARVSLPRSVEIFQVGRRLRLAGGHKIAVRAQIVVLPTGKDPSVVFGTDGFRPLRRMIAITDVFLVDRPGPRQGMVDHRDFVVKEIWIGFVKVDALLEDRLIVTVQRHAGYVVDAGSLEAAGLHLEQVVAAIAVLVDPASDRIALKSRLDLLGPVAPIGEDPPQGVEVGDQDVGRLRHDDEFQRVECNHHERHAGRAAAGMLDGVTKSAIGLIRNAGLQDCLGLG